MNGLIRRLAFLCLFAGVSLFTASEINDCLNNRLLSSSDDGVRERCEKLIYNFFYRSYLNGEDPGRFKQVPYGVPPSLYFSREIKKCMRSYVPVYKQGSARVFVTFDSIITVYLNLPDQRRVRDVLRELHNGCLDRSQDYCVFPVYSQILEDEMRLIMQHKRKPKQPLSSKAGLQIYKSSFEDLPLWALRILDSLRHASLEHCQLRSDNVFLRRVPAPFDAEPYGDLNLSLLSRPRFFEWTLTEEGRFWRSTSQGFEWVRAHNADSLYDQPSEVPRIDPEAADFAGASAPADEAKREMHGFHSELEVEVNDFQFVRKSQPNAHHAAQSWGDPSPPEATNCELPEDLAQTGLGFAPFAFDRFSMGLILLEMECQRIQCDFFKFKADLLEVLKTVKTIPLSEAEHRALKLSRRLSDLGDFFERNSSTFFWKTVKFLLGLNTPKPQAQTPQTETLQTEPVPEEEPAKSNEKLFQLFWTDESLTEELARIDEQLKELKVDEIDSLDDWLLAHRSMKQSKMITRYLRLQAFLQSRSDFEKRNHRSKTQLSRKNSQLGQEL